MVRSLTRFYIGWILVILSALLLVSLVISATDGTADIIHPAHWYSWPIAVAIVGVPALIGLICLMESKPKELK